MSEKEVAPIAIERDGETAIVIRWSDDLVTRWTVSELRKACPCATCREKRRAAVNKPAGKPALLPVLSAAEAKPLRIEGMRPVGTYAYNVAFTDGHSSGIFTFPILRREAQPRETDYDLVE